MSKSRAAMAHFIPSSLILLILIATIYLLWYPYPLLQFAGKTKFALSLVVIAGLIGPAMTFLVYKKGKRGLLIDLGVILIIQMAALAWGSMALYQARPFFMVFAVDRFEIFSSHEVDQAQITNKQFLNKPFSGPI
jgi:hypothetical protein